MFKYESNLMYTTQIKILKQTAKNETTASQCNNIWINQHLYVKKVS